MRCILIVLDGVGAGALSDAANYGDTGSNTLANTAKFVGGLNLPVLQQLGLGNIIQIQGVNPSNNPKAAFAKCAEVSVGKDTMTGHWEMMGIRLEKAFPSYPNGFPADIVTLFEEATGKKMIGNKAASGTEIIKELGNEHVRTGCPIVYTSADSVFQIASHKDIISLDDLYGICEVVSNQLLPDQKVARVIARPFIGQSGNFTRTPQRRDFTITPPKNILDSIIAADLDVIGIGKISEIFAGRGISKAIHGKNNEDNINITKAYMSEISNGLIFTNLSDFDTLWGHRNNPKGFAQALEDFDRSLTDILDLLRTDDLLFITADHGCDPTTPSTDHSREHVPLLVTGSEVKKSVNLGVRNTFADIGQTIADYLGVKPVGIGASFLVDVL